MIGALARSVPPIRIPAAPAWPILRRRLILAALIALVLVSGYLLWLRNSSLVAVDQVTVTGAEQNPSVEAALRSAGLEQTSLNVDVGALAEAVADDPAVLAVGATADFPHGLTIQVDLRTPVGYLKSAGLIVAGDGVVLGKASGRPDGVAAIGGKDPASVAGGMLGGEQLHVARVLGAAPPQLLALAKKAGLDADLGVIVELDPGLELRFGDPGGAELKWRAAAAVLADPKFTGAAYLDLSVPDRPVAGGIGDIAPPVAPAPAAAPATAPATGDPAAPAAPAAPADPATGEATDPAAVTPEAAPVAPAAADTEAGGTTLE